MQSTKTECKPLPKEYEAYGYLFTEVKREGLIAIYDQVNKETGKHVTYEVFVIEELPEQWVGPKKYYQPARENVPGKEAWGRKGWSIWHLDDATKKFNELVSKQSDKLQKE